MNFEIDLGNVEQSSKVDGHGQAKILSDEELAVLFTDGFQSTRDRVLFAICLFTGCRISEAVQLQTVDVAPNLITFRKGTTKNQVTRQVEISPALRYWLEQYELSEKEFFFPGRHGRGHLTRAAADLILKDACDRVGLDGVSTHSFRRSYITRLRDKGYSPAQIRRRTGHKRTESLMPYFDQV